MPIAVWQAYHRLDKIKSNHQIQELTALVSLVEQYVAWMLFETLCAGTFRFDYVLP